MYQQILETVNKLFIATDSRNWDELFTVFNPEVFLDYSSMTGIAPSKIQAKEIVSSWQAFLPGFDFTHHQLGNFIIESSADFSKVFCYGTANHYLKNESGSNIWTVVGTYDFELIFSEGFWRIRKMKFNFKYMDGNPDLPKLAQNRMTLKS